MATTAGLLSTFDTAYWLSFDPKVQALRNIPVDVNMPETGGRTKTAMSLATEGFVIDVPIMVWGWDAYLTMTLREQYGYTWVPSALMPPVQMAPGVPPLAGMAPYDPNNPPKGAIMVSVNPAAYPPFEKPVLPIPPGTPTSLVGINEGAGYYQAFPQAIAQLQDGEEYTADPRGKFIFHKSQSPFAPNGVSAWFTIE